MAYEEDPGVLQEDTMEASLWRETLGRSLESHNVVELVGGMCHGKSYRQETTATTPDLAQRRDGALSPTTGSSARN